MIPLKTYDYLMKARERVFDSVRALSPPEYQRQFSIGLKTIGSTLTHIMVSEGYYIDRLQGRIAGEGLGDAVHRFLSRHREQLLPGGVQHAVVFGEQRYPVLLVYRQGGPVRQLRLIHPLSGQLGASIGLSRPAIWATRRRFEGTRRTHRVQCEEYRQFAVRQEVRLGVPIDKPPPD